MKAKDHYYEGFRFKNRYYRSGSTFVQDPIVLERGPRLTDKLLGGVIVRGNKVTPNNFSYEALRIDYMRGYSSWLSYYNSSNYSFESYDGYIAFSTYPTENSLFNDIVFPDPVYNLALSRLNEKTRGSLDLSVDLLQSGQNAKMLNIVKRIREFSFSRGWRNLLKGGASARLEYTYGWRPLADSLFGVLDESIHHCINEIENFRARASQPILSKPCSLTTKNFGAVPGVATRSGRYLCEIKVRMKTKDFDLARWASLNPISWAYELTPYSFVLDWMIDVGGYLRNLETSLLYANSFVDGYVTKVAAVDASWTCDTVRSDKGYPTDTYVCRATAGGRYIKYSRSRLLSYPAPRLPSFKVDLGSSRLLNLAALLAQKLK